MGAAISLLASVALPVGTGFAVGLLSHGDVKEGGWYSKLKKPEWNPPNWVFGPAWSFFYTSMGVASWAVIRSGKSGKALPLTLYFAQLALNLAWTPLFFKAHKLDAALADSVALLGLATAATVQMAKKKPAVVWPLMGPYLCWLTFATALNAEILRLNPDETLIDYKQVKTDVRGTAHKAKETVQEETKKVATAVQETGAKVAAKAQQVGTTVSNTAAEVANKAKNDAAELAAITREAFSSEGKTGPISQ